MPHSVCLPTILASLRLFLARKDEASDETTRRQERTMGRVLTNPPEYGISSNAFQITMALKFCVGRRGSVRWHAQLTSKTHSYRWRILHLNYVILERFLISRESLILSEKWITQKFFMVFCFKGLFFEIQLRRFRYKLIFCICILRKWTRQKSVMKYLLPLRCKANCKQAS